MPNINLKLAGTVSDLPPWEAGNAYSNVSDFNFRRGFADRTIGDTTAITTGMDEPQNIINLFNVSGNHWVIVAVDTVQDFDGTGALVDITPAGWANLTTKGTVTSSVLNGYAVHNVTDQVAGWSWLPGDPTLTALPNSPNCRAIRAFGAFLVGFDTEQDATSGNWIVSEETVAWSDASEDIPATWIPDADNQAGSIRLGDTTGPVIDGSVLRGRTMIIGKSDALYLMDFVGGQSVFSFRLLTNKTGILTRNCMTDSFEGKIYGMSGSDFWVTDGTDVRSIADNKVRLNYAERLPEDAEGSFCAVNPTAREVWFVTVAPTAWSGTAFVYDIDTGHFGSRNFFGLAHARSGINATTIDDSWDGGAIDSWDAGNDNAWDFRTSSPQLQLMAMISATNTRFSWADLNPENRSAFLIREGIKGDTDLIMTCTRIWIDGELPVTGIDVTIGANFADDDPYTFGPTVAMFPGDRWVSVMSKGRSFAVLLQGLGVEPWSIQRIGLDVNEAGGRF